MEHGCITASQSMQKVDCWALAALTVEELSWRSAHASRHRLPALHEVREMRCPVVRCAASSELPHLVIWKWRMFAKGSAKSVDEELCAGIPQVPGSPPPPQVSG